MSASPAGPPSITPALRMSVQLAEPALPIERLSKQQQKAYVFSV